jgi:hypothetical protein
MSIWRGGILRSGLCKKPQEKFDEKWPALEGASGSAIPSSGTVSDAAPGLPAEIVDIVAWLRKILNA